MASWCVCLDNYFVAAVFLDHAVVGAVFLDHAVVRDEAHDLSNTLSLMLGVLRLPVMSESHLPFCVASFLSCVLVQ